MAEIYVALHLFIFTVMQRIIPILAHITIMCSLQLSQASRFLRLGNKDTYHVKSSVFPVPLVRQVDSIKRELCRRPVYKFRLSSLGVATDCLPPLGASTSDRLLPLGLPSFPRRQQPVVATVTVDIITMPVTIVGSLKGI